MAAPATPDNGTRPFEPEVEADAGPAPVGSVGARLRSVLASRSGRLALGSFVAVVAHLVMLVAGVAAPARDVPLIAAVVVGGVPLIWRITADLVRRQPGADALAALAIATSAALGEWLVGAIIVLMLSGGEALEDAATRRASAVLAALARRSPRIAHRVGPDGRLADIPAEEVEPGDRVVVLPHELCPVDGEVAEGHGSMDESYLTGEPYVIAKGPGSPVLSGAVNAEAALTVVAARRAAESRYAQIVAVLRAAEEQRPQMRRLADRLGAWYTLLALALATAGWVISGDPMRFLAVLVIATPCPLLIAVPVAIVGAISLAARQGIVVKNPGMLEEVGRCRVMIFDKTGTLTYGRPRLTGVHVPESLVPGSPVPGGAASAPSPGAGSVPGREATSPLLAEHRVLADAAALEEYSRHPLAAAIAEAADEHGIARPAVLEVAERPGAGLVGLVADPDGTERQVTVTSRAKAAALDPSASALLPAPGPGMEAVVLVNDRYAATLTFRDEPRIGAADFIRHLDPRHGVTKTMIISGDRAAEAEHLGRAVGITEVHAGVSPEGKLALVRAETARATTLFLGDGINDAPAMTAATVGVAFGRNSDVTAEAADAVVLDSSLERLDELLHIGARMRRIALQSALGGIAASAVGMGLAVAGMLPPLGGAVAQEVIDLLAVLNAARVAARRTPMADFGRTPISSGTGG